VALVAGFQIERRGAPGLWWPACLTAAIAFGAPPLLWTILPPGRSGFISWAYDAALIAVALLAHAQWRTDRSSDPLDLVIDLAPADESTLDTEERLAAIRLDADHERLLRELEAGVEELRASRLRLTEASDRARAHLRSELAEEVITPLGRLMEELGDAPSSPHEASAREHLRIATADIAALALGLAPRAVADGLSAALHELVDATPLPVQILADDVDLPSGVVTTAYYVCAEALANIERHAEASHAVVTVRALADVLLVRVEDDGVGGADAARGTGIRGLRDRLAAYEGRLEINSSPAGTRVEAILPLRALGPVPEPATAVTEAAP
jgi:signal transduction histidine kinase